MRVADRHVPVAPGRQAGVDVVLVGVDASALGDGGLDDRLDGRLLHIGQHGHDELLTAMGKYNEELAQAVRTLGRDEHDVRLADAGSGAQ